MIRAIYEKNLGPFGKMIGSSKGRYRKANPDNMVVFNANVCTKEEKVWYGDLDLTLEADKLKQLALKLATTFYVLPESRARFDKESTFNTEDAVFITNGKTSYIGANYQDYYQVKDGKFVVKDKSPYSKEDFYTPIKLPNLYEFSSKKADTSPLQIFALWAAEQLGVNLDGYAINPGKIFLTKEDDTVLNYITKLWISKYHTKGDDYATEREFSWYSLDVGFATFLEHKEPNWVSNGYVYIDKNFLIKKQGE